MKITFDLETQHKDEVLQAYKVISGLMDFWFNKPKENFQELLNKADLPTAVINAILNKGINDINELRQMNEAGRLKKIRNIGSRREQMIKDWLLKLTT